MLNVSATHELHRKMRQMAADNSSLRAGVEKLASLEKRLAAMESSARGKKLAAAQ